LGSEFDGSDFKVIVPISELLGLSPIWDVAIKAEKEETFSEAAEFLIKLHTKLEILGFLLHRETSSKFGRNLAGIYSTMYEIYQIFKKWKTFKKDAIRQINHVIIILKKFLEKTKNEPNLEKEDEIENSEEEIPKPKGNFEKKSIQQMLFMLRKLLLWLPFVLIKGLSKILL